MAPITRQREETRRRCWGSVGALGDGAQVARPGKLWCRINHGRPIWKLSPGAWEVCGLPRAPTPCICVRRGPVLPLGATNVVDSAVLSVTGYGPGFLAQALSIEQGAQAGCPPSAHSGHGMVAVDGWQDITGSEMVDLSLSLSLVPVRPCH